jgi:type II secretory pathway pseudopilin PulG
MTLIEVMVAFIILMVTLTPAAYLLTNEVAQSASARNSLTALAIAEQWTEQLAQAQDPPPQDSNLGVWTDTPLAPSLSAGGWAQGSLAVTRGGGTYHVSAEYNWASPNDSGTPDLCTSTPGAAPVLNLQVVVKWGYNNSVQDATNLDFPTPGIPAYGFLTMQVTGDTTDSDQNDPPAPWFPATPGGTARVTAIPVSISGQSTPIYPDQYGCVFAELNPGSYTVTVGEPSAAPFGSPLFVQNLATDASATEPTGGASSLTFAASISIGQTDTLPTLSFDEGANVGLRYASSTAVEDGVVCPGANLIACVATGENTAGAEVEWMSSATGQWATAAISPSNSLTRIASVACAGTARCVGVGYGPGGEIVSSPTTTSFAPTVDSLAGLTGVTVTQLTHVTCPSSSICVAIGNGVVSGTAGPIALYGAISAGGDVWTNVTLPTTPKATSLSQVVCSSASSCVAIGSTATGGIVLSGPPAGPWVAGTNTDVGGAVVGGVTPKDLTLTSLSQVACASSAACMALGTGSTGVTTGSTVGPGGTVGPLVLTGSVTGSASTWSIDNYPAALVTPTGSVSSVSQLACPSTTECLIGGVGTVSGTTGAFMLGGSPTFTPPAPPAAQNQTLTKDTLPAAGGSAVSAWSQLACPSSTVCVATGVAGANQAVLSGAITGTVGSDTWSAATAPSSVTGLTALSCPTAGSCLIAGTSTTGLGQPDAVLLSGSPGTSATWTLLTLPSLETGLSYLYGISCTPTAGATCTAVGATTQSAAITSTTTGPSGSWSDHTSDSGLLSGSSSLLSGNVVTGLPIELATAGSPGIINTNSAHNGYWDAIAAGGSSNTTAIGPIYPLTSGYTIFAGDCPAEQPSTQGTVLVDSTPGLTEAVTVPLGVLPLLVVGGAAVPSSDTVYLQSTASSPCSTYKYVLQTPGADGLSRSEVPFGSYNLTIKSGATTTAAVAVTVNPGSVTVGGTTSRLPTPVMVTGP